MITVVLKQFEVLFQDEVPRQATNSLKEEVVEHSLVQFEHVLDGVVTENVSAIATLDTVISNFGEELFGKPDSAAVRDITISLPTSLLNPFEQRIDDMVTRNAYRLLLLAPSFLLSYLSHRNTENLCLQSWNSLLSSVANHPETIQTSLSPLLDAAQRGSLRTNLTPQAGQLDNIILTTLDKALRGSVDDLGFIQRVLGTPRTAACHFAMATSVNAHEQIFFCRRKGYKF